MTDVATITATIISQIEAQTGQTLVARAFSRLLAKALAGVFVLLYKYSGWATLQTFVRTAGFAPVTINGVTLRPLVEWGRLAGVSDPTAATACELTVDFTVLNQTGSLPAGTQLVGPSNGVTYVLLTGVTLNAATVTGTVRAVADQAGGGGVGAQGNLEPGDELSFASPPANVDRVAVVASQTVTGADAESADDYRARVLDRFQKRPQGGAYADYEAWAEEVAGISRAYPYAGAPGQVVVYVEATVASSGDPDGIPTNAQLAAVAASIELDDDGLATRRPIGALVTVQPISRRPFDVTIEGLQADDVPSTLAEAEAALSLWFSTREPFIEGLSLPPRRDRITAGAVGGVVADTVESRGGTYTGVVLSSFGAPLDYYELAAGELAKLGTLA